jgi:hypothetical protein
MRINSTEYGPKDYPSWATSAQRKEWRERGLIVWDDNIQQVARMRATHALQLLEYLRTNDEWKSQGITMGEPATRLTLEDPDRDPEVVLTNPIELNTIQSQDLFDYLENNEARLRELVEIEEKEGRTALAKVYGYIIERGRRKKAEEEKKAQADEKE